MNLVTWTNSALLGPCLYIEISQKLAERCEIDKHPLDVISSAGEPSCAYPYAQRSRTEDSLNIHAQVRFATLVVGPVSAQTTTVILCWPHDSA